jgi:hypothetical protein
MVVRSRGLCEDVVFLGMLERSACDGRRTARFGRSGSPLQKQARAVLGWLLRTGIFLLPTVFEAEAVSIHLQNVDMMGEPIQ